MTYNTQAIEGYKRQTAGVVRYRPAEPQFVETWLPEFVIAFEAIMMVAYHEGVE